MRNRTAPEHEAKRAATSAPTTLLASIVNSSDDAIVSKTLDGTITSWNPAAEKMYGYSADEILGKNISMVSHPDRPEEMEEILARIRDGERVEHYETVRVRKDGRRISILLTVSPILDGSGKLVGASSVARDVTQRAGATLLASIVNSSDDAIDSKTLDGTITTWNPAAQRMYGYSADEILGKNISTLSHPDRPEEMDEILERIRKGERVEHYETVRIRKDGRRILDLALRLADPRRRRQGRGRLVDRARHHRAPRGQHDPPRVDRELDGRRDRLEDARRDDHELEPRRGEDVRLHRRGDPRQEHLGAEPPGSPRGDGRDPREDPQRQAGRALRDRPHPQGRRPIFSLTVSPILDESGAGRRRLVHRPRHHRAQARGRAAPRRVPVRAQPHRGVARPARHDQPRREDHRRQRGHHQGHRHGAARS